MARDVRDDIIQYWINTILFTNSYVIYGIIVWLPNFKVEALKPQLLVALQDPENAVQSYTHVRESDMSVKSWLARKHCHKVK